MFLKRHPIVLTAACAVAALLFAALPVVAGHGGGGGGHGGGGGGHGGGYHGGGFGGYGRGFGGYGGGFGGYGYGGYGGYGYGGYGYGGYPSYDYGSDDYSPNVIYPQPYTTVAPSYDTSVSQAAYAEPAAPDNRARVEVRVPDANAQVFFDGDQTRQTGMERDFVSPPLTPNKTYTYNVEVKWMENGKPMDQTRNVTVTPNQTATVDFGR